MHAGKSGREKISTTAIQQSETTSSSSAAASSLTNDNSNTAMSGKSSRCGVADMKKTIADRITHTMNEKVYPYMKFITSEAEMDPDFAPFAQTIMTEMGVEEQCQQEWWHTYKNQAKHALQQKRSSVCAAVKKSVIGKEQ